ncbi:hypothetical protein IWW34DRAFT_738948 [Fusarium oxysporum f. sp. albedinis]|nr:hypothetical protein FOMA001_g14323 [Fusarium oxysporum f. sp. matthiolae]KAI3579246.1 hypothetical protein IWW34DRAFT_738948 [Fusarium oxysporum f. sp. albedinis]KAJ0141907.1 Uncharacterized protein HZ326_15253 [Fusarium oxysporum f. sp. albedinis]KAK2474262.1 hypothetical protein H9L39_14222 [Fusarium oxysporum f. sp. albedinis]
MKFTATLFGLFGLFAAQAFAVNMYSAPNAAAECGALGVAEWDLDTLPAGMDVSELRKCKEHPLSVKIHSRNPDSTKVKVLEKRKCTSSKWKPKAGCDKHWCWQNCGSAKEVEWGFWCWSAHKDGKGAWMSCSNDSDCPTDDKFCGKGDCQQCGCGC